MRRRLWILILAGSFGAVSAPPALAVDKVVRKSDPVRVVSGTILAESPKGIRIRAGAATTEIPATDILQVEHDITAGFKLEYYNPAFRSHERIGSARNRKKAIAEALDNFEKLLPKVEGSEYARVRRNVAFRIATLTFQKAQEEGSSMKPGIDKLEEFLRHDRGGWQTVPAGLLLGRLLAVSGRHREAARVYQDLAADSELPEDARTTFRLRAARLGLRTGKYQDAYAKLQAVREKLPPDSRPSLQARVYQAECLTRMKKFVDARQKIESVLKDAKGDKEVQALAYNALGDCSYQAGQFKDALWQFLRVDVVYFQHPEEHAKALYYLTDLFKKLKDSEHEKDCRARLKGKEFAGTEYQARLLKEEKG